jgi:hypothetical protein
MISRRLLKLLAFFSSLPGPRLKDQPRHETRIKRASFETPLVLAKPSAPQGTRTAHDPTILFCALSGAPKILRLYGKGEVLPKGSESYDQLKTEFATYDGARAIIRIHVSRIADSCGYSVPRYEYVEQRDTLLQWADRKGQQGIEDYKKEKNASSIDGLPGL